MRVALAGPDHPSIADALVNQGNVLLALGQPEAALGHHLRALTVLERARGHDDTSLRVVLNDMAVVYQELGRYDEALDAYRRALAMWVALEPTNPVVGVVHNNMAEIYMRRGEWMAARDEYDRGLEVLRVALPERHPFIGNAIAGGRAP